MRRPENPRYLIEATDATGHHDVKLLPNIHDARVWLAEFRELAEPYGGISECAVYKLSEVDEDGWSADDVTGFRHLRYAGRGQIVDVRTDDIVSPAKVVDWYEAMLTFAENMCALIRQHQTTKGDNNGNR